MLTAIKSAINRLSLSDWVHIVGIALILMAIGAWKQSVDDHIRNQDRHIVRQDATMQELANTIRDENLKIEKQSDKLDSLKDDVGNLKVQTQELKDWVKLEAANKHPK